MLHEQQQTISVQSNVWEWTHVLLVITPCWHLHSFCATGVNSGLATRVTLIRVPLGRMWESISRGWVCFWFKFVPHFAIVVGLRFKWYKLYNVLVRSDNRSCGMCQGTCDSREQKWKKRDRLFRNKHYHSSSKHSAMWLSFWAQFYFIAVCINTINFNYPLQWNRNR
jgi:hypothetical protein